MLPLASLLAGGISTNVSSKSGDAQSPFDSAFQYNAAFQVGGSGSQSQSQSANQDKDSGGATNNNAMYVAAAIVGLIALAAILSARNS